MRPPRLLVGAALIFWGWHADLLLAAVPAAVAAEIAALIALRVDLNDRDFQRIADLCIWVLAGVAGFAVLDAGLPQAVVLTVELLPLAGLPLVLAQTWSTTEALRLEVLFRLGAREAAIRGRTGIHSGFPFFALCLLGAAAANVRSEWFYPVAVALCGWALWGIRSPRYARPSWLVLFGAVAGCGYLGHMALASFQHWLTETTMELFTGTETDPYRSTTAIGHIGELKLSDQILVRVQPDKPIRGSLLLHRASYDTYAGGTWFARDAALEPVRAEEPGTTWPLVEGARPNRAATVYSRLNRGKGVLALPAGTARVEGLTADELERNRHGTVRIEKAAPIARYTASYSQGFVAMGAPTENDLKIPFTEARAVRSVWNALGAEGRSGAEIVTAISDHFGKHFSYSIYQEGRGRGQTPMREFLERTRAGHCEHFATATVLLLRAAGIPARYATGYSVQEYSELEEAYIVRERHAHAWTRYYLDGAWQDLDTTPGVWVSAEAEQASLLEPLTDWLSWIGFRLDQWRAAGALGGLSAWWLLLLVPLVLYVGWRSNLGKRRRAHRVGVASPDSHDLPGGADSDFYRIEKYMQERGLGRAAAEPVTRWLQRVQGGDVDPEALRTLRGLAAIHYRYRFDPAPLDDEARSRLSRGVDRWLDEHTQ